MNTLSILIVVDVLGALADESLINNVYMVDTNHYLGSWQEGSDALHTLCQDGQLLQWYTTSVSPNNDIEISSFSGEIVSGNICIPSHQGYPGDSFWAGRVETHGRFASYSYTITLTMGGKSMSFSPYLKVAFPVLRFY